MLFAVEGGGFFSSSASGYSKGLSLLLLGQKTEDKPMRVTPWNQYQLVDHPDIQLDSDKNCLVRGCAPFVCFGRTTAGLQVSSPLKVVSPQRQEVLLEVSSPHKETDLTPPPDVVIEENCIEKITLKSSLKKTKNAELEIQSPLKVVSPQQQEVLPEVSLPHKETDLTPPPDVVIEENCIEKVTLKSSLKKPKNAIKVSRGSSEEHEVLGEEGYKVGSETERRKVQLEVPCDCDEKHEETCEKGSEVNSQMKIKNVQWKDTAGGELVEIQEFEPSDESGSDDEFGSGSDKNCSCTIM